MQLEMLRIIFTIKNWIGIISTLLSLTKHILKQKTTRFSHNQSSDPAVTGEEAVEYTHQLMYSELKTSIKVYLSQTSSPELFFTF